MQSSRMDWCQRDRPANCNDSVGRYIVRHPIWAAGPHHWPGGVIRLLLCLCAATDGEKRRSWYMTDTIAIISSPTVI